MSGRPAMSPQIVPLPSSDGEVVSRAQAGESEARRALFLRYAPELAALLRRILGRSCDVEDAVQQAFLTAFEQLPTLSNPNAFRPWIYKLAIRSASRSFWTLRMREIAWPGGGPESMWTPDDLATGLSADDRAELVLLGQRLARLPLPLRQAWVLRYQFDCTLPEAALVSGCSLATIKRRIDEAQRHLEGPKP